MEVATSTWRQIAQDVADAFADWLPRILGALAILAVGWVVAVIARRLVEALLRRLGVDRLADRSGLSDSLEAVGLNRSASALMATVVYWLVLLFFVLIALEGLGLTAVTDTLGQLVGYLPHVLVAAFILLFGSLLARVVGDAVATLSVQYGVSGGASLGRLVQYLILGVTVVVALEQLLIDTSLLTGILLLVLGGMAVTLALAFGLGTRDIAGKVVAGLYARDVFKEGDVLRIGHIEGRLLGIGRTSAILMSGDQRISLPNDLLLGSEVIILGDGPAVDDLATAPPDRPDTKTVDPAADQTPAVEPDETDGS